MASLSHGPSGLGMYLADIFDSKAQVLVNPVNCEGVAGAGLAKQFKEKFPQNFQLYRRACLDGSLTIGKIFWCSINFTQLEQKWIANFPTKYKWRNNSKLYYIIPGLEALLEGMLSRKLTSVAMPKIGCGLGGLDWNLIKPEIESIFGRSGICVLYT